MLVSGEKGSHSVSDSRRGLELRDILIFKEEESNKKNQMHEETEPYGKYLNEFQRNSPHHNLFYNIKGHGRNSILFRQIAYFFCQTLPFVRAVCPSPTEAEISDCMLFPSLALCLHA